MKSILIIGMGRFGRSLAKNFTELGQEVMAVDTNESHINDVLPYVTSALIGDAEKESFLNTIGVRDYDLCIVAIGDNFQSSLEVTYLLKQHGAKYVVSRASRDIQEKFLLNNGADEVVYPERQLAEQTAIRLSNDSIFDYFELDKNCVIYDVVIPKKWVGHTISELEIRKNYALNIIGARVNGKVVTDIDPYEKLQEGRRLLVAGTVKNINKCFDIR